jgi:hypothetical protein
VPSIDFSITASDPDNGSQPLTVGLVWDLTNKTSGSVTSARAKVASEGGTAYSASIPSGVTTSWLKDYSDANTLHLVVTTTDINGGISTFSMTVTVYVQQGCSNLR